MKNQIRILNCVLILLVSMILGCDQKDTTPQIMSQVDKLLTFWNTGNFEGIDDVLWEDFEMQMSPNFEAEKGIENFKESVLRIRKSYPDFTITIEEAIISGNAGAGRWIIEATSKSGEKLNVVGMSILHFEDGKIKDEWILNNDLLWLEQLNYTILPPEVKTEE